MVQEMRHPKSLNFCNERKVKRLREDGWSLDSIAAEVRNLEGQPSTRGVVGRVLKSFPVKLGRARYGYSRCGRKADKMTEEVKSYLVKKVRKHRNKQVCTSTTLQRMAKADLGLDLDPSHIRKALRSKGYSWLKRRMLRKYSKDDKKLRLALGQEVAKMKPAQVRKKLAFAMDGVILTIPPSSFEDRQNYCSQGDLFAWMKKDEVKLSSMSSGREQYERQVPLQRALPLWGGISENGYATVLFHKTKKLNAEEWSEAVEKGKLADAIRSLEPDDEYAHSHVICDNEKFLRAKESMAAYKSQKIKLWKLPPRSPDMNPVERFWGWLRKALLKMDMADLKAKRPVPGKFAYKERVRRLLRTKKAQTAAANFAKSWRSVCMLVVKNKGDASGK